METGFRSTKPMIVALGLALAATSSASEVQPVDKQEPPAWTRIKRIDDPVTHIGRVPRDERGDTQSPGSGAVLAPFEEPLGAPADEIDQGAADGQYPTSSLRKSGW
jgi:hypothetical protein